MDHEGKLALVNEPGRVLFGLNPKDLGRPAQDLELFYRPAELRSLIDRASSERRANVLAGVERRLDSGDPQYFDLQVTPLYANGGRWLGTSITFEDVTVRHRLQQDLQRSTQELETTNEELQSAHEELETTNEELQSSNEELETMNEELQSTNVELQTMNTELRQRTDGLYTMNSFMQAILGSLRWGIIVVDHQLNVMEWNRRAEDLWGLRADEVRGRSLMSLDIGLPVGQLPIASLLSGTIDSDEMTLPATNRRGRAILCNVILTPFITPDRERGGVVLTMEEREIGQRGRGEVAEARRGDP